MISISQGVQAAAAPFTFPPVLENNEVRAISGRMSVVSTQLPQTHPIHTLERTKVSCFHTTTLKEVDRAGEAGVMAPGRAWIHLTGVQLHLDSAIGC